MEWLLTPLAAFIVYLLLVGVLSGFGRFLAGSHQADDVKSSTYSGGETFTGPLAAPGYKPFFVISLFFAILHLGVLMIGSSDLSLISGLYLVGLLVTLWALVLG